MQPERKTGRAQWKDLSFQGVSSLTYFIQCIQPMTIFMGYSGDEDKVLMSQSNLRSPLACKQGFSSVTFKRMVHVQATTLTDDFRL